MESVFSNQKRSLTAKDGRTALQAGSPDGIESPGGTDSKTKGKHTGERMTNPPSQLPEARDPEMKKPGFRISNVGPCQTVLIWGPHKMVHFDRQERQERQEHQERQERQLQGRPTAASPRSLKHLIPFIPYLDKARRDLPPEWFGVAPIEEPHDIEVQTIRNWLQACDKEHACYCEDSSDRTRPQWLVDVEERCLVPAEGEMTYIALSYVWGKQDDEQDERATSKNLADLRKPDGLSRRPIPKTIRDSINLVRLLKQRYLWVDRFCILQDEGDDAAQRDKAAQLMGMADIYAGSYVTIVAAGGKDANDGLNGRCGIRDGVDPLTEVTSSSPLIPHHEIMELQASKLTAATWFSRGWTFQEYLFSRRKIVFQNNTVNWECHGKSWHENQANPDGSSLFTPRLPAAVKPLRTNRNSVVPPWPNLHRYARMVALFNQRQLSRDEDVLDAFAGVLSTLSPAYKGGFVSGLPYLFFDAVLLWQPYEPLTRREPTQHGPPTQHSQTTLPSWSWVGWQGNLHSESWMSGYDYLRRNPDEDTEDDNWDLSSWRTKSTVSWRHAESPMDAGELIVSIYSPKSRAEPCQTDPQLPQGWTRHACESLHPFYYKYRDLPQEFWYPIPMQDDQKVHKKDISRSPFLRGKTHRGKLTIAEFYPNDKTSLCPCAELRGDDGWAGVLRMMNRQYQRGNEPMECDLIELSAGTVENQELAEIIFDEWQKCPERHGRYEFYNVMWIGEEEKGIFSRKAVGRVRKNIWEKVRKGPEDITLK